MACYVFIDSQQGPFLSILLYSRFHTKRKVKVVGPYSLPCHSTSRISTRPEVDNRERGDLGELFHIRRNPKQTNHVWQLVIQPPQKTSAVVHMQVEYICTTRPPDRHPEALAESGRQAAEECRHCRVFIDQSNYQPLRALPP